MSKALVAFHNQEIRFYQLIGTKYSRFVIPRLYGFEQSDPKIGWHGRLLISDVGQNACTASDNGLSIAQVLQLYYKIRQAEFSVVPP